MKIRCGMIACLLLGMRLGMAEVPGTPGEAAPAEAPEVLTVDMTCVLSAEGPSVERGELVVRLHEYDPRLMDRAAAEIGRIVVSGFSHRAGEETVLRFPCTGTTGKHRSYYITAVVYPEGAGADRSGIYYLNGFQRVLEDGGREALRAVLTPVAEVQGAGN